MSLVLNYYMSMILSVKTQIVVGKKKVAKPILMLAIIEAISKNHLTKNEIKYTDELETIYIDLYAKYGEVLSPMKYPFYHMQSDGFYHLKGNLPTKSPTPKQLREKIEYAYLDNQLWSLLLQENYRVEIQKQIEDSFELKIAYGNEI